jgi:lysophospholipase L1-like esterase
MEESHPSVFFELLKNDEYVENHVNMAQSGFTTTTLLEQLNDMSVGDLSHIKDARVITINIGGNNILLPFTEYLSELNVVSGGVNIASGAGNVFSGAWGVIYGIASEVGKLFSDSIEGGIGSAAEGVGDIVAGAENVISGAGQIISGTPRAFSTFRGSFSPELEAELEKGIETFSEEFKQIINWIEENAPRATIIVNTVYNPIPQEILFLSLEISNIATVLIDSINYVIIEESEAREWLIVDINTHLSNQLDMAQFNLNSSAGSLSVDIIHPNTQGHALIAQLHHEALMGYLSSE